MQNTNRPTENNNPESSQKSAPNLAVYKWLLVGVIIVEIIVLITLIIVKIVSPKPDGGAPVSDSEQSTSARIVGICEHGTKESILGFVDSITKDDAMKIIGQMKGEKNCVTKKLLPEEFKLQPGEYAYKVLYSYDDISEVPDIAEDSVMKFNTNSVDDFKIDKTTEWYTIISVDPSKKDCKEADEFGSTNSCYRGISFDRKHLNHYEKVEGTSHSSKMVFNDLSPDFVEFALKIIAVTDIWNGSSLYDYYFEDDNNYATFTGIYFGVGIDMNKIGEVSMYNIPYAINIYEKKLILDKTTRESTWQKYTFYGEEGTSNNLKSIPLSDDDYIELYAAIYGLGDDEIEALKNQMVDEDEMTDAERLEARVSAICYDDYSTIYRNSDNTGIFKCNDYTKAIYSVTNSDRTETNYKNTAYAAFLGTDDDETANQFFGGKLYIYQNFQYAGIPNQLILLLESQSEESLVEDNLDSIYNYIKELNKQYKTDLTLHILYTEDLSQTSNLKDYIVLTLFTDNYAWLPHGNGFGNYFYDYDENVASLFEIAKNPDLYSNQTRNAIKFHRHIEATIENGKDITKEELKQLLYNSFKDGQ